MNDIDKADRIVGISEFVLQIINRWTSDGKRLSPDTYRRGAYFEWLDAKHACGLGPGAPLADIAAEVVRIDAEERRKKEPDDGLPPGPWRYTHGLLRDATDRQLFDPMIDGRTERLVDYVARCGSPAVRRLLAAYDVTEEQVHDCSVAVIRMANEAGTACATRTPWAGAYILCWLTPRSKQ